MTKVNVEKLTEAQETLLIPLWARAEESRRPSPILRDEKALELVEAIDYDFDIFTRKKVNRVGICARASVFDSVVRDYLKEHPAGTVVEIGAGLDTRFDRLDNGRVRWFELDLPAVMEVRRRFFQEQERRTFLTSSVLEPQWLDAVQQSKPESVLFVAEGVFYFFSTEQLKQLFSILADRFPGSAVVFDSESPFYAWYSNLRHPLVNSKLLWSVGNLKKEVEGWDPRFRVERTIGFGDSPEYDPLLPHFSAFHRTIRRVWPPVRNMFRVSIVRLG